MELINSNLTIVLSAHAIILGFAAVGVSRKHAFRITNNFHDPEVRNRLRAYNLFFTFCMFAGFVSFCIISLYASMNYDILFTSSDATLLGQTKLEVQTFLDYLTLAEMVGLALLWPGCFLVPDLVKGIWTWSVRALSGF